MIQFNASSNQSGPYSNENDVAKVIYCHVYSHQFVNYLEVDLRVSKATRPNKRKLIFIFLHLAGDWTQELSVLNLLLCHLSHYTSRKFKTEKLGGSTHVQFRSAIFSRLIFWKKNWALLLILPWKMSMRDQQLYNSLIEYSMLKNMCAGVIKRPGEWSSFIVSLSGFHNK